MFFWKKSRQQQLSAYIDGELPPPQEMRIGEQLVFDDGLRSQLAELERTKAIISATLTPTPAVGAEIFVANLEDAAPRDIPSQKTRRHLAPAALAAAGILVTAGITLASLRRRGIV
ncbi:MAG: anti-sigma factor RsiW [Candidatus Latescibacterota bacterium]|jgi:anti-sigma factor RsiW